MDVGGGVVVITIGIHKTRGCTRHPPNIRRTTTHGHHCQLLAAEEYSITSFYLHGKEGDVLITFLYLSAICCDTLPFTGFRYAWREAWQQRLDRYRQSIHV